jgi:hypothetical protein
MAEAIARHDARPPRTRRRRSGMLARRKTCPDCNGTGSLWVACPDAGVCKVDCACMQPKERSAGSIVIDLAVAGAFVSGCGILFFSL